MKEIDSEKRTIVELYKFMCKSEGIKEIKVCFAKVGKGGACCTFNRISKQPLAIYIDLNRIDFGAAYVLCHETAHQINLIINKWCRSIVLPTRRAPKINTVLLDSIRRAIRS
jgi:hypothetical protein